MGLDAEQVHKPVRKIRKLLKKLPKEPTPEQVHQLRTNSRRLQATLASLSLDLSRRETRLLKHVNAVRKKAGKVRDMDVLIGSVPEVVASEQECRITLLEQLGDLRRRQARKLHAEVRSSGKTRSGLKRVGRHLEAALCERKQKGCDPVIARSNAAATALTLESELGRPEHLGKQNLHAYRLKVKELQNVLRLSDHSRRQEFLEALNVVKDSIGEWHDWEELFAIGQKVLDHGSKCELLRAIKTNKTRKFETALRKAVQMRRRYFGLRPGKANGGFDHRSASVWKATAAIAT
jgi:CHAD domain-containing protein